MIRKFCKLTLIIGVALCTVRGHAQVFPVDETGRACFRAVVEVDSIKKEQLYDKGSEWLLSLAEKSEGKSGSVTKDSVNGTITAAIEFLVYSQKGVLKKMSGAISYTIRVEVKDNKYRYSFTDLLYHYYAMDRNYHMVQTGKTKRLDDTKAAGWQKLWDQHRRTAYNRIAQEISALDTRMKEKQPAMVIQSKKTEW